MTFRHSVFFLTAEQAQQEEEYIRYFTQPDDIYQMTDEESGWVEVRFFTHRKLDRYEQNDVSAGACWSALNYEVWERSDTY